MIKQRQLSLSNLVLSIILFLSIAVSLYLFFSLNNIREDAEAQRHSATETIQQLETKVNDLEDSVDTLSSNLSDTKANLQDAQSDLADAEAMIQDYEAQNESMSDALAMYGVDFDWPQPATPRHFDVPLAEDLQDYIWSLCCTYEIEEHYALIFAMIKCESNFNAWSVSSTNDYGLMQINVINHPRLSSTLGIVDFLDPYQNVHAGIFMISSLLHKYENPTDALMAYNMGQTGAARLWARGIHTTRYTEKILNALAKITEDI